MRDRFREPVARLRLRVGVEDRPDQRGQQPVLIAPGVAEAVPEEVDRAAPPAAAQDLGDRRLQAACASEIASWTPTSPRAGCVDVLLVRAGRVDALL
jgi:hypothetical protein